MVQPEEIQKRTETEAFKFRGTSPNGVYPTFEELSDRAKQPGILASAAFVLGLTAGQELPSDTFERDVIDHPETSWRAWKIVLRALSC